MTRFVPSLTLAFFAAVAAASAPALAEDAPQCELDRPVMFAGLSYDSAQFHTRVAEFIIEHGYGCAVDALPGAAEVLINAIGQGRVDVIMEIWTGNPAPAWVEAEAAGKAMALGTAFPSTVEGWFVPTAIVSGADAVAPDLRAVSDLPEYKDLFKDPEEPDKGRFYNCPAAWVCQDVNTRKLEAYGLDDDFTNFPTGTEAAIVAAAESGALRNKPVLFYYWGPTALLGRHDFTRLEEPPFDRAVWAAMLAADHPSAATAYPVSEVVVGAATAFAQAAPKLAAFLSAYSNTTEATQKAQAFMADSKDQTGEAAARDFLMNNEDMWTKWVPEEVAARVKAALGEG
jgi:glycine betaine/proline transport system substrate-binding protein